MTDLLVIVAALSVGAFVKGVSGTGLPQVAIPVMAAFLGVERAVIIMSIPGIAANVWLVVAHRAARRESRDVPVLLGTGIAGAVLGTVLLTTVDARFLSAVLAVIILVYVGLRVAAPNLSLPPSVTSWVSPPVGFAAGALQGATGVSGPLLSTYLHAFALSPGAYIFSLSSLFLVFSATQVVTLVGLGAYTTRLVLEGFLALVPVAVMLPLGSRLGRRLGERTFSTVVMVGLAVAAAVLLAQALGG
ncbi:MAG TPA: sulfite exporter TauE/SafE family protein [Nocardioides sp.]|nr:sulfite exporter TauE/SafE family protein [Nocardioides sp.]